VLALLALATAAPSAGGLAVGSAAMLLGCSLRCWAFSHLGAAGRTRDPGPPVSRVVTGPYAHVAHPVYLSNLLIAVGMLLAASPPWVLAAGLFALLASLYFVLALRESRQLAQVTGTRDGKQMSWWALARSERSTWLQLAVFQCCLLPQL